MVTPPKNQASCGTSSAFAATAQYESMLAIATNGTLYDLAVQYGLQCTLYSIKCMVLNPFYALSLYKNNGIPLESAYPFN